MATGDIFEVTVFSQYLGEAANNVFHYVQTAGSGASAPALLIAFETFILGNMADIQSEEVSYQRVKVMNLSSITDNAENTSPTQELGDVEGTPAPSFLAINFQSDRPDLSWRHSYKRFAGLVTAYINGNSYLITGTGLETAADDLADWMSTAISEDGKTFAPCQIRKTKVGGVWTYDVNYVITNYEWDLQITTQNTRKPGRGD